MRHAGDVFEMADQGNTVAQGIVDEVISEWATMFANIAHTVDPYVFVLGGGCDEVQTLFHGSLSRTV